MLQHSESIDVDRPPEEVYAFIADSANDVHWRPEVTSSELVAGEPARPGAQYRQVMKPRRREMVGTHEIVAIEPGRRVDWRTPPGEGPLDFSGFYGVEPRNGGSTVTIHTNVRTHGVFRLGEPFMKGYLRKVSRRYTHGLKDALERPAAQ
jgi:uncharacterized protein YndB with AHSA1/START domain